MELEVYTKEGKASGKKVKLPKHVFGIKPSEHAVYMAVKAQRANERQGNAATRTRSMVRGGGRKPWRQKGRGVARAGTSRSPLWIGGGRTFGPQPRSYTMNLPKQIKVLARLSVLSNKASEKKVKLVEDFQIDSAKTKDMFSVLQALELQDQKTLLLLKDYDSSVLRAGRNIPRLRIRVAATESTYDLLDCEQILIQEGALDKLSGATKK
jgi:large subunit ribosomal protein L4